MGLDMHLRGKRHVYIVDEALREKLDEVGKLLNCKITAIAFEAGYWRKANAIHQWFVDNVQNGDDNCGAYLVSQRDLVALRSLCAELLANKDPKAAAENLPPQEGFFFGSTEIDEEYWQDLQHTVEHITALEKRPDFGDLDFEYQSSW
jgi:hypothetical protein